MKFNIDDIKSKIISYFKDKLDQTVVMLILSVTIANAIFVSIIFYLAVLSPSNLVINNLDYKYIRIKVNQEVLDKLEKRKDIDQETMAQIETIKDPFN